MTEIPRASLSPGSVTLTSMVRIPFKEPQELENLLHARYLGAGAGVDILQRVTAKSPGRSAFTTFQTVVTGPPTLK